MKLLRYGYDEIQAKWMFDPIRSRRDTVRLLMNAVKVMLVNHPPPTDRVAGEVILAVSKMSRLFFVAANKIVTIAFPFVVDESAEGVAFRSPHFGEVDSRVTSHIVALLDSNEVFSSSEVLDFAVRVDEEGHDLWALFRHLLIEEDGYLRYDYDPVRHSGHRHPLHHLDVFHSGLATFKVGLQSALTGDGLRDALDLTTDCFYLSSPVSGSPFTRLLDKLRRSDR